MLTLRRRSRLQMGGVTSGSLSNMIILVGLKAPVQVDTSMEPNVMGDVPTQTLVSPIIPLSAISPSANFVTS